jgi:hypothetical protein
MHQWPEISAPARRAIADRTTVWNADAGGLSARYVEALLQAVDGATTGFMDRAVSAGLTLAGDPLGGFTLTLDDNARDDAVAGRTRRAVV